MSKKIVSDTENTCIVTTLLNVTICIYCREN
uniref:Uncharacterized protein n=1 Tax=Anguilla anguilla TaxID=7936 RepID=A0A0E9PWU3_ANGAN